MNVISSKAAVGLGLLLVILLAAWWVPRGGHKNSPPVPAELDHLLREVRWEGPWYYQLAKRTHAAQLIPVRMLNMQQMEWEISHRRWQAAMALSRLGTNAWPVVPGLLNTLIYKDRSAGIFAAEALAGVKAEECPQWADMVKVLRTRTWAAKTFLYLVARRNRVVRGNRLGPTYDVALCRLGLIGLAATGPAAEAAYSDIVEVLKHDEEPELRACAATALGSLETERNAAVPLLKGVLQDKEEWPVVSAAAAQALATAAPAEAETFRLLRQSLQDPRSAVRLAAARAMWRMNAPAGEVLPVLTALLNHKLASTRTAALKGLSEMGSAARPSMPEVQRLTSDEEEPVRRAAAETLKNITRRGQGRPGFGEQSHCTQRRLALAVPLRGSPLLARRV